MSPRLHIFHYFDDRETGRFFMRVSFRSEEGQGLQHLQAGFSEIQSRFGMDAEFFDESDKRKSYQ